MTITDIGGGIPVLEIDQEATIKQTGAYSAKVKRNDALTFGMLTRKGAGTGLHAKPGRWYRIRASARGTSDMAIVTGGPFRIQLVNNTNLDYIQTDGKSIATSTGEVAPIVAVTAAAWTTVEAYFRIPSTWLSSHDVAIRFSGYWTSGESLYYDDVSVYGPVLRPGVATW